jgi:hypothetical protein
MTQLLFQNSRKLICDFLDYGVKASVSGESCLICLEPFASFGENPFDCGNGHIFGASCFIAWMKETGGRSCFICVGSLSFDSYLILLVPVTFGDVVRRTLFFLVIQEYLVNFVSYSEERLTFRSLISIVE